MNRKIAQLFQSSFQLYFVCLILFALVSAFFSLLPVSIEHNGQFSALFWGGLFALAEYMFHEDDYLVV